MNEIVLLMMDSETKGYMFSTARRKSGKHVFSFSSLLREENLDDISSNVSLS